MATAFQRGAFQFGAFQEAAVGWHDDMPLHLLRHNPAELERRLEEQRPFNRKRFDRQLALERAAREEERKRLALLLKRKRREEAQRAARMARIAVPAAIVEPKREKPPAPQPIVLVIDHLAEATNAARRMQALVEMQAAAAVMQAAVAVQAQAQAEDDDARALALLL